MNTHRIKIEKENITSGEINKYKNFKRLVANYNNVTQPIARKRLNKIRNRRIFMAILLIIFILWLLFSDVFKEEKNIQEKNKTEQQLIKK
ncbi:MAG: hypothetical protein A2046_15670 [Bacteroidetes bacterium GWA2_30_7]|nr:MAG: hypothetical protein A2046_15670 [Bacteroidetes bacterium GWA2_30_7]